MSNRTELLSREIPEQGQKEDALPERPASRKSRRFAVKWSILVPIVCIFLCLGISTYCFLDMFAVGANAVDTAFTPAMEEASQKIYQQFYNTAYEMAEEAHHTSNRVSISIGNLRETQKLEVLAVSEVSYQAEKQEEQGGIAEAITGFLNKESNSWLEVPGSGVFTVNLQAGEFIVDEVRQTVLIRIPGPELTNFTLDYENVEVLYFDEGGVLKNSAKYGVDKAMKQLQNAELELIQEVSNNQELYNRARAATENMLTQLVRQLNPHLLNLTVEVEFLN